MGSAPETQRAAAALAAGEWEQARAGFEAALKESDAPESWFGLGSALWWLGDTDGAVAAHENAYGGFRRRADAGSAALAALQLCLIFGASFGNHAAAQGWAGRLARLVEQEGLPPMRGWLALCRAANANETSDPSAAEVHATAALAAARSHGDTDLELCALSELGVALLGTGRVGEGLALLDEAMAGALAGEGTRLNTVVFTGCRSITACSRSLEVERAVQWVRASDRFTRRYGNLHLYTTCRTQYGGLLFCQGRWEDAERELRSALHIGRTAEPRLYAEALAKLAELRVAQGRLEEAEELLRGFEGHATATYPRAQVQLRRGRAEVAVGLLHRRLEAVSEELVENAPLSELTVDAEIATGDLGAAGDRAVRLVKVGERSGSLVTLARGLRALGRVRLASGDGDEAAAALGRALDVFTQLDLRLDTARTHLLLARAVGARERASAVEEARLALAMFEELGAADADEAAAFLRRLGVRTASSRAAGTPTLTSREHEVLALLAAGLTNREIAERLFLARKTVERHVRNLFTKLGVSNRSQATAYAVRHLSTGGR